MTAICTKCRYARQASDDAPEWQCPGCGIAYAKAAISSGSPPPPTRDSAPIDVELRSSISWTKAVLIVAVAFGAWQGIQIAMHRSGNLTSVGGIFDGQASAAELTQLASTVKPGDVLIYTTTDCPYCAETKSWMREYGFPFVECGAQKSAKCESELKSISADGVPYLIVRGKHLKEGFDSDEFVAALH